MAFVKVSGEPSMCVLQCKRQRQLAPWNDHKMSVVRHEAVSDERKIMISAARSKEVEVNESVVVGREHGLSRVAALKENRPEGTRAKRHGEC